MTPLFCVHKYLGVQSICARDLFVVIKHVSGLFGGKRSFLFYRKDRRKGEMYYVTDKRKRTDLLL